MFGSPSVHDRSNRVVLESPVQQTFQAFAFQGSLFRVTCRWLPQNKFCCLKQNGVTSGNIVKWFCFKKSRGGGGGGSTTVRFLSSTQQ